MATLYASELRNNYGIEFKNLALMDEAFTHSSYVNEHRELGLHDNERLEFLGDAVMELTVSEFLYQQFPDFPEGKLTRLRAAIVCTKSFSSFAREAHFDQYIRLGKGEENAGARNRDTLLEDCFEAFNGALYLDQGKDAVVAFLKQVVFPKIKDGEFTDNIDHKTHLQEQVQEAGIVDIDYRLLSETGPSHDKIFSVEVAINGTVYGKGTGRTKKAAEQTAAEHALAKIKQQKKA